MIVHRFNAPFHGWGKQGVKITDSMRWYTVCIALLMTCAQAEETPPKAPSTGPVPLTARPGMRVSSPALPPALFSMASGTGGKSSASRDSTSYPMFHFNGPDVGPDFWADPQAAGRALVLQGELMQKMGEVLVKQGQALLNQSTDLTTQ